jgi:hypothetical protein
MFAEHLRGAFDSDLHKWALWVVVLQRSFSCAIMLKADPPPIPRTASEPTPTGHSSPLSSVRVPYPEKQLAPAFAFFFESTRDRVQRNGAKKAKEGNAIFKEIRKKLQPEVRESFEQEMEQFVHTHLFTTCTLLKLWQAHGHGRCPISRNGHPSRLHLLLPDHTPEIQEESS